MASREIVPYGVEEAIPLSITLLREVAPVPSNQSYFAQAICCPVIAPSPPHLLLQDKPHQSEAPKIKVPKEINLLPPRANKTLTGVKTNNFGDVTCTKYKSVMPRLTIDGVRAAPEHVKVMPPKEKKRAPPSALENEEKFQQPTVAMLQDKIKTLTEYTHAPRHRIDKEHIHCTNLEYELTILSRYIVNQDKFKN
jgi:hypothetical protein